MVAIAVVIPASELIPDEIRLKTPPESLLLLAAITASLLSVR
jgi:hypothetical protein